MTMQSYWRFNFTSCQSFLVAVVFVGLLFMTFSHPDTYSHSSHSSNDELSGLQRCYWTAIQCVLWWISGCTIQEQYGFIWSDTIWSDSRRTTSRTICCSPVDVVWSQEYESMYRYTHINSRKTSQTPPRLCSLNGKSRNSSSSMEGSFSFTHSTVQHTRWMPVCDNEKYSKVLLSRSLSVL